MFDNPAHERRIVPRPAWAGRRLGVRAGLGYTLLLAVRYWTYQGTGKPCF